MKWFAIFKTGKHTDSSGNTREWTEEDLDKIVNSYDPSKHEAPIVIGHPKTNAPAFGWIEKLKRVGDTLYALPKQLAQEFVEMVNRGLFKKRSISLYPDGTLRHVGFLGATPPAVKGLPDVEFNDDNLQNIEMDMWTDLEEPDGHNYQDNQNDQITQLNETIATLTLENKELKEKVEKMQELINELRTKLALSEFEEYIDKKIDEGKVLPKQKETLMKLYERSIDFNENNISDIIKEFIESMPKIDLMTSPKPSEEKTNENKPATILVAEEIRKNMPQL
jgi:hypothetical protein